MILVDSNILLRAHPSAKLYPVVKGALTKLRAQNEALCVAPQNLVEFWAVATRPLNENGLGMDIAAAKKELSELRRLFLVLPYTAEVLETWERTVVAHGVVGKQTHDAHLVAIMQVNAVQSILTFNGGHFERFSEVTALDPAKV